MLMNGRIIQHFLFVLFLCLMNYDGVGSTRILKKKPPTKTIKTEYGDIYDCVDFHDQPAFDNPLLKNHKYHPGMKPSWFMEESSDDPLKPLPDGASLGLLPDGGCPVGTVPIKRYSKKDLIRQKGLPPSEDNSNIVAPPFTNRDNLNDSKRRRVKPLKGYKRAIVTTQGNPNNKFGGAGMMAAIYNPTCTGQQNSACRLKLIRGNAILQTGWRVDPTLYGDNKTRLFIHFDDGKHSCFDLLCPNFIVETNLVTLGQPFVRISDIHGIHYDMGFLIQWDQQKGNWWLILKVDGKGYVGIGYWPKEVFDDVENYATTVEWGGVVYSPAGVPEPPMGSGLFPIVLNAQVNAFCRNITLLNDKGENIDIIGSKLTTFSTTPSMYNVIDIPNFGLAHDYNHTILYGGPGEF